MHINIRTGQIASDQPSAMAFAVDIAGEVENATGHPVAVWQGLYGQPLGSISWSVQVDGFADIAAMTTKLAESSSYVEKVQEAQDLWIPGSFHDRLARAVHSAGEPSTVAFVSSLTAVATPGKQAEAAQFGVEATDYVSSLTGNALTFCVGTFTDVGEVTWLAVYADAEAVDAAQETIAGDAGYQELTAKAGELFIPGTATMTLSQRLN